MARRNERSKKPNEATVEEPGVNADALTDTPLWSKYYQEVRKRIRFPRYYKRALNW